MTQTPAPVDPDGKLARHRGTLVLILGIVGAGFCFVAGIASLAMGARDLARMRRGEMDPAGRRFVQAGAVLGAAAILWQLAGFLVFLASRRCRQRTAPDGTRAASLAARRAPGGFSS